MPKGIPHIKYLYSVLRGEDADCLRLPEVIELLKDVDKRLESVAARLDRDGTSGSKSK